MEGGFEQEARKLLEESLQALKVLDTSTGYEVFSHSKQVESMRKPSDTLFMLRGVCEVPLDYETIRDFIKEPSNKAKWDPDMEEVREVIKYSDDISIVYNRIKTPPGVSGRDAVYVQGVFMDDDENIFIPSRSVDFPGLPIVNGIVRVNVNMAGYVIKPTGPRSSVLSYIFNVDPKGALPNMLVNLVQKTQTRFPGAIRDLLKAGER